MASKSSSSGVVLIILLILTFPFWIGLFGIMMGLVGGFFGIVFGFMGAAFSIIAWPFKTLFGFEHFHINGVLIATIILLIVLVSRRKQK